MKKYGIIIILLIVAAVWHFSSQGTPSPAPSDAGDEKTVATEAPTEPGTTPSTEPTTPPKKDNYDDLSAQFMTEYGKEDTPPQKDIQQISGLLESYFILVKAKNLPPMGENREVAAALTGENPYRTRLLNPDSPWLNEAGELVDRWKTPLYFHAVDERRVGVRSAGPDAQMWTPDDLISGPDANPVE